MTTTLKPLATSPAGLEAADLTIDVTRVRSPGNGQETIFIPLPVSLHRDCGLPCCCSWCVEHAETHPELCSKWDTLAIGSKAPKKGNDYTWTIHYPEISQRAR